ncbi:MAG: amidophosphoribosyltransferase, partial [Candidatus Diapherotrites archaeon]
MSEVKHSCGLAAVSLPKARHKYPLGGAAFYLYKMLLQQQNRGQLSAGITTYNEDRQQIIDTYKKLGTVNEAFCSHIPVKSRGILKKYSGSKGIGQVRYATSGPSDVGAAQPWERHHGRKWKWFSFAFNGNIANFAQLRNQLNREHYHLVRKIDTEIILHHFTKSFVGTRKPKMTDVFGALAEKFDGAYNINFINA